MFPHKEVHTGLDDLIDENAEYLGNVPTGTNGNNQILQRLAEQEAIDYERYAAKMEGLLEQILKLLPQLRQLPPDRSKTTYDRIIATLVGLSGPEWSVFCRLRKEKWDAQRRAIIRDPAKVRDKMRRITALSDLRYGTPHWEIDASLARMKGGHDLDLMEG